MTNTVSSRLLSVTGQMPIAPGGPTNWKAKQIIYLKISMRMTTDGLEFFYHPDSGTVAGHDIQGFINSLFGTAHDRPVSQPLDQGPLDFLIKKESYVVFELDRKGNWHFRPDADALSTDDATPKEYFDLMHVISPTNIIPGRGLQIGAQPYPAHQKCNIAYFSAISPSKKGQKKIRDSLNLYVRLSQHFQQGSDLKTRIGKLDIIIDPDIQNTGGSGGDGGP